MYPLMKLGLVAAGSVLYAKHALGAATPLLSRQNGNTSTTYNVAQATQGGLYLDPTQNINNSLLLFPGASVIGYGLNIFQIQPFDASTIPHALQTDHRLIKLKSETQSYDPGSGAPWKIPSNIACNKLSAKAQSNFDHYDSGLEAEAALSAGGGASGSYQVVTGDASVNAGLSTSFNKDYQYGLYEWKDSSIRCGIEEWGDHVDKEYLTSRILRLSRWDANNHDTIDTYREFFSQHGTHIVTDLNLGAELSVSTWATNQDFEINANFTSDVKAKFSGIEAQGAAESHVKNEAQYRKFEAALGSATVCRGGDESIAAYISENPEADDVADKLVSWIKTTQTSPIMTGTEIRSISAIISDFDDANVRSYHKDLNSAYLYIASHPKVHRTKVRMVINSDWGEVELLSPSAFIEEDPDFAKQKPPGFQMSSTKVGWWGGKPTRDETIDFVIRNDGNPVDLHLGHGLDGPSGPSTGVIEVTVEGQSAHSLVYGHDGTSRFDQVKMNPIGVELPAPPQLQSLISVELDGTVLTGTAAFNGAGPLASLQSNATAVASTHNIGGSSPGGSTNGYVSGTGSGGGVFARPSVTGTTIRPYESDTTVATSKKQRRRRVFEGEKIAKWIMT